MFLLIWVLHRQDYNYSDKEGSPPLRGHDYTGGNVIEPHKGVYRNLMIVDAVNLYPSMAILYNISFETINCECCMNRKDAKVPAEVLDKGYWICKMKDPQKLREFRAERAR